MRKRKTVKRSFDIRLEFEVYGEEMDNVVATCAELNVQTTDETLQGAVEKLAEAVNFYFDTAEARHELKDAVRELSEGKAPSPPWSP